MRWLCSIGLVCVVSCTDDASEEASGTGSTSGASSGNVETGSSSSGDPSVDGTTGDEAESGGTGSDESTGGADTTGGVPRGDATLVVYLAEPEADQGQLFMVNIAGEEPSEPVEWSPSGDGGSASPSVSFFGEGDYASFTVVLPDGSLDRYIAPVGAFPPDPAVRMEGAGLPDYISRPVASHDRQFVAFNGGDDVDAPQTVHVATLEADGSISAPNTIGMGSPATTQTSAHFSTATDRVFFTSDGARATVEQVHMQRLDARPLEPAVTLSDHAEAGAAVGFQVTPDGQAVVYGVQTGNQELFAVDVSGDVPSAPLRVDVDHVPPGAQTFRLASVGHTLVYLAERSDVANASDVYVRDLDAADPAHPVNAVPIAFSAGNPFGSVTLEPGGDLVVMRGFDDDPLFSSLHWATLSSDDSSTPIHDALAPSETVTFVRFSPSGDRLYYFVLDRDTGVRSAFAVDTTGATPGTPEALELTVDVTQTLALLQPSPDGTWLAYSTRDESAPQFLHMWIRNLETGEDTRLSQEGAGEVEALASFSSDSLRVLFAQRTDDPDDPHLFVANLDGETPAATQQVSDLPLSFSGFWVAP